MEYLIVKWVHIISATLLFGTGLGSAFYKWCADRQDNIHAIAHTNRIVVLADWVFTTPTILIQPISGIWMLSLSGYSAIEPWLILSYVLYAIAGLCWLPVVWLQIRMRDLAIHTQWHRGGRQTKYAQYARLWFWLGVPAFLAMLAIVFLMVVKPGIH